MFFGDEGFQNMFFYQPTFNMLDRLAHVAKVTNRNASDHSNLKSDQSCSIKSRKKSNNFNRLQIEVLFLANISPLNKFVLFLHIFPRHINRVLWYSLYQTNY